MGCAAGAFAAERTVRDIVAGLYKADRNQPVDLSGLDLHELDLSGIDFKGARLSGSNLFGADLSGSDLSQVDLKGAHLDRVTIVGTRFDGADLTDASLLRPSTFSTLVAKPGEAINFAGAKLTRARLFGRFNGANFSAADLRGAKLAPFNKTGFIEHIWRTELSSANLSRADLSGADLSYSLLAFTNLRDANLSGARFNKADLSRADLSGADLSGADFTEADLDGTVLRGARGLDTARGLQSARNWDRTIR
jgi:uncharacterized protein YjbI with pentapeptide repeats